MNEQPEINPLLRKTQFKITGKFNEVSLQELLSKNNIRVFYKNTERLEGGQTRVTVEVLAPWEKVKKILDGSEFANKAEVEERYNLN
ncbi:MAG TPA: hypothetical protein VG694_01290 [Candidatus Paceibacterota bacterium]|nr:hypothetical protein [Candidatus Paceibacterota bacterium]